MQEQLMKYSPDTGEERPYPSNAKQWREYHGRVAWLYNPWTGEKRDLRDIGCDVFGELIVPPSVETSNTSYSSNCTYQNTNRYHGADVVLVGCDPISCKHWDKVYGHLSTPSDQATTVKPVRQILDDTESWILEAVQSAERLLLGTTAVSYWVKFPLSDKVGRKLTREKETLVYVSGNTKTKYYCATENVAILAQSSVVLLDDDNSSNPVSKALFPCSSVMADASYVERGNGGDKVDDFPNTLKRRFYELTPFQREILANNYTKVEHYRDNEWRTKKGTYFHKDGIYRVAPITTY